MYLRHTLLVKVRGTRVIRSPGTDVMTEGLFFTQHIIYLGFKPLAVLRKSLMMVAMVITQGLQSQCVPNTSSFKNLLWVIRSF